MPAMRVLYVLHQFFPKFHSGTEQFVLALARAGRARGDDVRVVALDPDFEDRTPVGATKLTWAGVPVTILSFDKNIANWTLREYDAPDLEGPFAAILDEFDPEVAHVFHLRLFGLDRLFDLAARSIPIAVHVMDFWFVCPNFLLLDRSGKNCDGPPDGGLGCIDCTTPALAQRLRAAGAFDGLRAIEGEVAKHESGDRQRALGTLQRADAMRQALKRAQRVYAPSHTVADRLVANGHDASSIVHAPYGVDRSRFGEAFERRPGPITIGFLGTFAPHKGVDVLVEGFRRLEDPDVRLAVHGRFGDYRDFDERLKQLAGDDERIQFVGPFGREELGSVLQGLDIVVVPSRWRENTPFVCLEARIAGIRLLVSDLPGMTEAVPVQRGRAFRAGDPDSLTKSLEVLIDDVRQHGPRLESDTTIPSIEEQYEQFRRDYVAIASRP
ncbi:MAG: glycosyltransferase [Planctomycetes bacterium]|nr:glycosyltransferase [Planctomycetota bacterium]MCB9918902.1 glycosyltransferase [Planctomycetota bacterium]